MCIFMRATPGIFLSTTRRLDNWSIWAFRPNGPGRKRLTDAGGGANEPRWVSDSLLSVDRGLFEFPNGLLGPPISLTRASTEFQHDTSWSPNGGLYAQGTNPIRIYSMDPTLGDFSQAISDAGEIPYRASFQRGNCWLDDKRLIFWDLDREKAFLWDVEK